MVDNQEVKPLAQNEAATGKTLLEEKLEVMEKRLNELAENVNAKVDAKADTLVAKVSKKIIDSRFTAFIVGGACVYFLMSLYICM